MNIKTTTNEQQQQQQQQQQQREQMRALDLYDDEQQRQLSVLPLARFSSQFSPESLSTFSAQLLLCYTNGLKWSSDLCSDPILHNMNSI